MRRAVAFQCRGVSNNNSKIYTSVKLSKLIDNSYTTSVIIVFEVTCNVYYPEVNRNQHNCITFVATDWRSIVTVVLHWTRETNKILSGKNGNEYWMHRSLWKSFTCI